MLKKRPMDTEQTAAELAAEQAAAQVPKEEDIRAQVIEDYGFDPDVDQERIEKLTNKEIENRQKLSQAIGQKIKHRTEADELRKKVTSTETRTEATQNDTLSARDALILAKANVTEEDLDTVLEWAKFKKLSVSDTLKDPTLKNILATKDEERKTALATQTRGGARGSAQLSGEDILAKAEQTGEVPDTTEGMQELFKARQARRLNRNPKR